VWIEAMGPEMAFWKNARGGMSWTGTRSASRVLAYAEKRYKTALGITITVTAALLILAVRVDLAFFVALAVVGVEQIFPFTIGPDVSGELEDLLL